MKRLITILFILFSFASFGQVTASNVVLRIGVDPWNLDTCRLYIPTEYADSTNKRYPLLLFFLGSGEVSDNYNVSKIESTALPYLIANGQKPEATVNGKKWKFIVIVYQPTTSIPAMGIWGQQARFGYYLSDIYSKYRIDTSHVYTTGISLGAQDAWSCAIAQSNRIAASYPISFTGYSNSPVEPDSTKTVAGVHGVKLWTVVGSNDNNINGVNPYNLSQTLVNDYNTNTPSPLGIRTVISGGTHSTNTWNVAYDTAWRSNSNNTTVAKNMYEWFIQYSKTFDTSSGGGGTVDTSMSLIPLSVKDAYTNQHTKDDFGKLIDGATGNVFTVWNNPIHPYRITFDTYDYDTLIIKRIKYYINNGNAASQKWYYIRKDNGDTVKFFSYNGGTWNPAEPLRTYDVPDSLWRNASSFIFESYGNDDFPDYIELWGKYHIRTNPLADITHPPLSDIMGAVVKPWDVDSTLFPEKQPALKSLGVSRIRLYDDYVLNHDGDSLVFTGGWNQTSNLRKLKNAGISSQVCYLSLPSNYPWPVDTAKSVRYNPATYSKLATDVYKFGINSKNNGGYIKVFELLNEQNCWYCFNDSLYYDGYALAAMCSIAYDGHKGAYANKGIKAADSTILFSIGGLAEAEPYLLYQIMEWSRINRGYRADGTIDLPFDVYSFHLYSSLEGQRQGIPGGTPPEIGMETYMNRFNVIRKRYFPWLKIHVGEWGWDVNPSSDLNAPAYGSYSPHQTSAMWTARAMMLMAAHEMNAASYYRIVQDFNADDSNATIFKTMALQRVYNEGGTKQPDGSYLGFDIRPTLTGSYFKQLGEFFNNGYVFDTTLATSPYIVRFKKDTSLVYAIWQGETMTVDTRPRFTERTGSIDLPVRSGGYSLRQFVDNGSSMSSTNGTSTGTVTVSYSAKPVFITTTVAPATPEVQIPTRFIKVRKGNRLKFQSRQ